MPNTVVKLTNAESTWLEAAWEDRKLLIKRKAQPKGWAFYFILILVIFGRNGWEEQAAD